MHTTDVLIHTTGLLIHATSLLAHATGLLAHAKHLLIHATGLFAGLVAMPGTYSTASTRTVLLLKTASSPARRPLRAMATGAAGETAKTSVPGSWPALMLM